MDLNLTNSSKSESICSSSESSFSASETVESSVAPDIDSNLTNSSKSESSSSSESSISESETLESYVDSDLDLNLTNYSKSESSCFSSESSFLASETVESSVAPDSDLNLTNSSKSESICSSESSFLSETVESSVVLDFDLQILQNLSLHTPKDLLDRIFTPILAQMMTLSPNNDNHPDVQKLYKWLIQPECTVTEFDYIVGPLQKNVCHIMMTLFEDYIYDYGDDGDIVYLLKIAAEALAVRGPVLEGQWARLAWRIFSPLGEWKNMEYGPVSTTLSNWIIHAIGDSYICSCSELRLQMLRLYRALVKIDDDNREKALESLMFACSSLRRHGDNFAQPSSDFIKLLMLFTENHDEDDKEDDENDYIYQFGRIVAEKLKQHRNPTLALPKELQTVQSIIALLKYVSDEACAKENEFVSKQHLVEEASRGLNSLVRIFKVALQEPILLCCTAECLMNVMEAAVIWAWQEQVIYSGNYELGEDELQCFFNIQKLLEKFCDATGNNYLVEETPVGMEIIMRYSGRICWLRSLISKDFLNCAPNICRLIYNKEY